MTAPLFAIKAVCQDPVPSQQFFNLGIFCNSYYNGRLINVGTDSMVQTLTLKKFFENQISLHPLILVLSPSAIFSSVS